MKYTVYQTTNLVNGFIYIGVHKTINPDDSYLGSGIAIKGAIKKYGKQSFVKTILHVFEDLTSAYVKEAELVTKDFVLRCDTYNLCVGGSISPDHLESRKLSYSARFKGENHPQWGKKQSAESNAKRAATLTGRKLDGERVEKSAAARRGKPSPLRGGTQTASSNAKRSKAHLKLEKLTCPVCDKEISPQNAKRWHFEMCVPRRPRYSLK